MNETTIIQTRETFALVTPPLGTVQVQDELGLSYLEGDIDFGATGRNEILQNIKFIILTDYYSVPLDREFGMDYSMVDKPMRIAEAILSQEIAMKIALYEPRAQFREISYLEDMLNGKLSPSVKVALLTTNEGPSLYRPISGGEVVAPITKATIASGESFSGTITGLAGAPGPSGSIVIGQTITGEPGTDASVVNSGTPTSAVLEFTIPRGDKGEPGEGINIEGSVPDSGSLPTTGNDVGDIWIDESTGDGWSWNGTEWINIGPIQGPKGDQGDTGAQGPQGATGTPGAAATISVGSTITGAPGTNAIVANVGSSSAAIFDFTIPRGSQGVKGDTGNQGIQGIQGIQGAVGPSNVLSVQSTTTGAAGTNANVTISETSPTQSLAFTIPRGDQGIQGIQGIQGSAGNPGTAATVSVGTTTTGAAGSAANVTNSGTSSAAILNFTIPQGVQGIQGVQGVQGNQGVAGPPNVLTVSDTITGSPGTNASVTISGTSPTQALTFTVPQGLQGAPGTPGINSLATSSANGLLRQTPNLTTSFVDGTNNYQDLATAIKPTIWSTRLRQYNAIGNPNFEIDQRNSSVAVIPVANGFAIDRWYTSYTGTLRFTCQQLSENVLVPGTQYCISTKFERLKLTTVQASLGAADIFAFDQVIEGSRARECFDVTSVSLLVRSSVANTKFSIFLSDWNGTTTTKSLCKLCTIPSANTWTLIQLPNIPVFPAGNFANAPGATGYALGICLAAGANGIAPAPDVWQSGNYAATSGATNFAANAVNSTFDIAYVQHEPGAECTQFIDVPWGDNYNACLRYFYRTWSYGVANSATLQGAISTCALVNQAPQQINPYPRPLARNVQPTYYSPTTVATNTVRDAYSSVDRAVSGFALNSEKVAGYPLLATVNAALTIYQYHIVADTLW